MSESVLGRTVRHLWDLKEELRKTQEIQMDIIDKKIAVIQEQCPHTNESHTRGWEGDWFFRCEDCYKRWE